MFEDFSFSTPSSRPGRLTVDVDDRLMVDCDSSLVSPLSSRCPSPQSHRFRNLSRSRSSYYRSQQQQHQPPPTSVPFAYESKRLSISTLTRKLHEHTLQTPGDEYAEQGRLALDGPRLPGRYAGYVLTPPDTDHDSDGRAESSPSLCSNPSPTSIPPEFLALDRADTPNPIPDIPDHLDVRIQRQQISQLQCNEGDIDAVRRTVVAESTFHPDLPSDDCHPSSLPPRSSPRRRALTLQRSRFGPADAPTTEGRGGRLRSNSCAMQSHRIEKSHHTSHSWRDMSKRGDHHGLRRKSMVSAALASVVERS